MASDGSDGCERCGQLLFVRPVGTKIPFPKRDIYKYLCDPCKKLLYNAMAGWWYSGPAVKDTRKTKTAVSRR